MAEHAEVAGWSQRLLRHGGRVLRLRRQALALTQAEVGARAGLSGTTISQLEQGLAWPRMEHCIAIVQALDVPWLALFPDDPTSPQARLLTLFARTSPQLQQAVLTILGEPGGESAPVLI